MSVPDLPRWLEKLDAMLDPAHLAATRELQRRCHAFEPVDHLPTVVHYPVPPDEWPTFSFLEIFEDRDKLLLNELAAVYAGAKLKDDRLYGIRANYGTGIIASLFGCPIHTFDHALPVGKELTPEALERVLERGVPSPHTGLCGKALATVAWFRDTLRPYPRLAQAVGSQLLDIQGPFDNASIIWGSSIFLALYDEPEKAGRLMDLVVDATLAVIREHRRLDGCSLDEQDGDWNGLGGLCVRNDSTINLSGEMYQEWVKPRDARLLAPWGGWMHWCGKAHAWWKHTLDLPRLQGINPFQGEFYHLLEMYGECERARMPIIQWTTPLDAPCRDHIRTGLTRMMGTSDYDCARRTLAAVHRHEA